MTITEDEAVLFETLILMARDQRHEDTLQNRNTPTGLEPAGGGIRGLYRMAKGKNTLLNSSINRPQNPLETT